MSLLCGHLQACNPAVLHALGQQERADIATCPVCLTSSTVIASPPLEGLHVQESSEDVSTRGHSPGGDSPDTRMSIGRSEGIQQQIHNVLSAQGLRDSVPDD